MAAAKKASKKKTAASTALPPGRTSTTTRPELRLDRQLCFAIASAHRAVALAYAPLLAPLGLTHPQYLVMLLLWEESPRPVTEIADRLFLDTGTVTPLLKRLAARGLIARRRSVDDERVVEIHLTAEGRALAERATEVPHAMACAFGKGSSGGVDALAALREQLHTLSAALRGTTLS